jgi:hypothetical protein
MQRTLSWKSMFMTARVAALIVGLTAVLLLATPEAGDMLTEISDFSTSIRPAFGFHMALLLMAFFAWHWSRAALSARFDLDDTPLARSRGIQPRLVRDQNAHIPARPFKLVPRLLFVGTAFIGIIVAVRSADIVDAIVIVVWSAVGYGLLEHRLAIQQKLAATRTFGFLFAASSPDRAEPEVRAISMSEAFWRIMRRAPFGRWFALAFYILALGLFVVSGVASFFPSSPLWLRIVILLGHLFPGPSAALLCLGLAIGPLTVLTFVADRRTLEFELYGWPIKLQRIPVLTLLAVVILATTQLVSLHDVRIATPRVQEAVNGSPAHLVFPLNQNDRPALEGYFRSWLAQCAQGETRGGTTVVRPIIVAVSGGASRAGLWGARVLVEVDAIAAENRTTSIFAISSVSGGSVGAAAYVAALHRGDNSCRLNWPGASAADPAGKLGFMRDALRADALGPTMVGALLGDVQRAIIGLPAAAIRTVAGLFGARGDRRVRGGDRAEALERAFEANWTQATKNFAGAGKPVSFSDFYLSLFYDAPTAPNAELTSKRFAPMWLANGTDGQNGDRILTAPVKFTAAEFPSARDALLLLDSDIPVSTAIDNTARFPFLSPSGELASTNPDDRRYATQVIDGGYFENEGMETALDLAAALKTLEIKGVAVEPIIVQATADADPDVDERRIVRCTRIFHDDPGISLGQARSGQFVAPLVGLNSARGGHSHVSLRRARAEYCGDTHRKMFFHFYLYRDEAHDVPLNWTLSQYIADYIWDDVLEKYGNSAEVRALRRLLPKAKS